MKACSHAWLMRVLILSLCAACHAPGGGRAGDASTAASPLGLPASFVIPGIPNRPDLVTVIPFYRRPNESWEEHTKVVIPAAVDGWRGIFIVDLGAPQLYLNRTFLQPSPAGGVDTVTTASRRQEKGGVPPANWDSVHVRLRLGTLTDDFDDPSMGTAQAHPVNAVLNHHWGNFANFAPRLGNLSLSALEPFETILDYVHQRVVLIRLDSAGRRLADVPAYTPRWSAPLIDVDMAPYAGTQWRGQRWWGVRATIGDVPDSVFFDTGSPYNLLTNATIARLAVPSGDASAAEPALVISGRSFPDVVWQRNPLFNLLGGPFLRQLGVVGFNHRAHQLLLYRE